MTHYRLEEMTKGWFVGDFSPVVLPSKDMEVAIKRYREGDVETAHRHEIAVEITAVVNGRIRMLGREWGEGDIIVIQPGEATSFEAMTDAITVVVKSPSAPNDKYLVA